MNALQEEVAFGHYRVCRRENGALWELGRGATSVTYKAMDTGLMCPVALKVIDRSTIPDEERRRRLASEARAAAKLMHPNIARVFFLGRDDAHLYYAMEYVPGESAKALVDRWGPMDPIVALKITGGICRALAAGDRKGLVHRDVKPSNIVISSETEEDGQSPLAKLIDFGLALNPGEQPETESSGTAFFGTPQFASPEQVRGEPLDTRSDIYSLGCTLWFLLTGEAPFTGSVAAVFSKQLNAEPPWERVRTLQPSVRELLRTMLSKAPQRRPRDPIILSRELETIIFALGRQDYQILREPRFRSGKLPAQTITAWASQIRPAYAACALLLCLATAGLFLQRRHRTGASAPSALGDVSTNTALLRATQTPPQAPSSSAREDGGDETPKLAATQSGSDNRSAPPLAPIAEESSSSVLVNSERAADRRDSEGAQTAPESFSAASVSEGSDSRDEEEPKQVATAENPTREIASTNTTDDRTPATAGIGTTTGGAERANQQAVDGQSALQGNQPQSPAASVDLSRAVEIAERAAAKASSPDRYPGAQPSRLLVMRHRTMHRRPGWSIFTGRGRGVAVNRHYFVRFLSLW